jgi:hypothetical protein
MKKILGIALLFSFAFTFLGSSVAEAAVSVRGYYKPSSGTYVAPSYRSSPNSYKIDNYSSKGNYNPYSGKKGSKSWY